MGLFNCEWDDPELEGAAAGVAFCLAESILTVFNERTSALFHRVAHLIPDDAFTALTQIGHIEVVPPRALPGPRNNLSRRV